MLRFRQIVSRIVRGVALQFGVNHKNRRISYNLANMGMIWRKLYNLAKMEGITRNYREKLAISYWAENE
jgi:hypothetical protein